MCGTFENHLHLSTVACILDLVSASFHPLPMAGGLDSRYRLLANSGLGAQVLPALIMMLLLLLLLML